MCAGIDSVDRFVAMCARRWICGGLAAENGVLTALRRSCLNQGQVSSVIVISTKGWPRRIKGWQGWGEGGNPAMTPSSRLWGAQITENSRALPLVSHAGVPCGHVLLVH